MWVISRISLLCLTNFKKTMSGYTLFYLFLFLRKQFLFFSMQLATVNFTLCMSSKVFLGPKHGKGVSSISQCFIEAKVGLYRKSLYCMKLPINMNPSTFVGPKVWVVINYTLNINLKLFRQNEALNLQLNKYP